MSGYTGIDCAGDARSILQQAEDSYGKVTVVGRYLFTIDKVSTFLSPGEIAALLAAGKAIALVCNLDQDGSVIGAGGESAGANLAERATLAALELLAPPGTRIFFDVEAGFRFGVPAALGMVHQTLEDGFLPGFYLNPISGIDHASGYAALRAQTAGIPVAYWTAEQQWDDNLNTLITEFLVDSLHAAPVPGYADECVGWQTAINRPPGVDLDCWKSLDGLWKATATSYRIVEACALKSLPSHVSGIVVADLAAGAVVALDPEVSPPWQHIHTSHENGWVLSNNLEAVS